MLFVCLEKVFQRRGVWQNLSSGPSAPGHRKGPMWVTLQPRVLPLGLVQVTDFQLVAAGEELQCCVGLLEDRLAREACRQ